MKHIVLVLLMSLCVTSTTMAASLGISGSYSSLKGEVKYNPVGEDLSSARKYDAVISRTAFGLLVSTELDKDKRLSYRLNCSVYIFNNENTLKEDHNTKIQFKGAGVDIVNTIGFNIVRSQFFVLWAGLGIGLGCGVTDKIKSQSGTASSSDKGSYEEYFIYAAETVGASFRLFESIGLEIYGGYKAMPLSSLFNTKGVNEKQNDKIYGVHYGPYIELAVSLEID